MRNWISKHKYATLFLLLSAVAVASGVPQQWATDNLRFGIPTSTDDKVIEVNTGDGVNNPKITVDMTDKDFEFNKALTIVSNQLTFGSGATGDQVWEFDIGLGAANPKFKWDQAAGSLAFANDGVNFKNIGSGSGSGGGGVNTLAEFNFDFETADPPQSWNNSGGAFIAETTDPLFGEQSGSWDSNALGQTLDSTAGTITTGFIGNACSVQFRYTYGGANGDYKVVIRQFDDSASLTNVVYEEPLNALTNGLYAQFFDCPDDKNDTLTLRFESTVADADILILDDAFVGTGRNTVQLDQAYFVGGISHPSNIANCIPVQNGHNVGFREFVSDGDCPAGWTALGNNTTVTGGPGVPNFTLNNLPAGSYIGYVDVPAGTTSLTDGNYICTYAMDTGATRAGHISYVASQTLGTSNNPNGNFTFTFDHTGGNRNLSLRAAQSGGSGSRCGMRMDLTNITEATIKIYRVPSAPATAVTFATSGFNAGARFDVTNAIFTGTTSGQFLNINSSAALITQKSGDSASLQIPCSDGNPSTGDTCDPQAERLGISWIAPSAGDYKVCFAGAHFFNSVNAALNAELNYSIKIGATENNSETIIQEGDEVVSVTEGASNANTSWSVPWDICHTFRFPTAGRKTVRLYHNYSFGTNVSTTTMWQSTSGTGQAWSVSIEKITEQKPTPVFLDIKNDIAAKMGTFNGDTGSEFCSFSISNTDTAPAASNVLGGCVASVIDTGSAAFQVNFTTGFVEQANHICICMARQNSLPDHLCVNGSRTATSHEFVTYLANNGARQNSTVDILCVGR